MTNEPARGVHWSFRTIGAVALIWNVLGVINFFMQVNAGTLAAMPESQRAIIEGRPAWATGAFAIAVFGGAWLPSASAQEVRRVLLVCRVATWRACASDPLPGHSRFNSRLRSRRDLTVYPDAAGAGGVIDLVFEAGQQQGLDQLGTVGKWPVEIYFQVEDVDGLHNRLKKKGVAISDPLTLQWWRDHRTQDVRWSRLPLSRSDVLRHSRTRSDGANR